MKIPGQRAWRAWPWLTILGALLLVACTSGQSVPNPGPSVPGGTGTMPSAGSTATPGSTATAGARTRPLLLVTNSTEAHVTFIDPREGVVARLEVGPAPHGLALGSNGRAYAATSTGVAVIDTEKRELVALVPYRSAVRPTPEVGEYRPGGMGIAASPDGRFVYVGVYLPGTTNVVEVLDTERLQIVDSFPVGVRPFDVAVSGEGTSVYSIDHDSYSVTGYDVATKATRTIEVAPLGRGAYDKPHYAAVAENGELLLAVQGRTLVMLDGVTGARKQLPLTAQTHQHGIALSSDGKRAVIIGTGPAGGVSGGTSLTVVSLPDGEERIIPLTRPHERVALSADGQTAYLTGGYLLAGGWDGITVVDLKSGETREVDVRGQPLGIVVLP